MRRIVSIFLSVLLLASSSGIAYAQHFCGEQQMMAKLTLGDENLSCGMNSESANCTEDTVVFESHDCCKNHVTKISIDDNFVKASFNKSLNKIFLIALIPTFFIQNVEVYKASNHFNSKYNPPPIDKDIPIFYQSFLI